jgi:hypothetical protein
LPRGLGPANGGRENPLAGERLSDLEGTLLGEAWREQI